MRPTRTARLAPLLLWAAGCQPAARSAGDFDGRTEAPSTEARAVRTVETLPLGYERLGRVAAHCRPVSVSPRWEAEWLSDVDCSVERLTRVLGERAAEVGGELLVNPRCSSRPVRPESFDLVCRAEVGRRADSFGVHRFVRAWRPANEASEAWLIRVDFTPTGSEFARPSRPASEVHELPDTPVSHVALGELATSCGRGCSERGAHEGLRAAAARRGANAIAQPSCRAHADGWLCTATATAYRVDPEHDPRAR
jgi:hypothetical protein